MLWPAPNKCAPQSRRGSRCHFAHSRKGDAEQNCESDSDAVNQHVVHGRGTRRYKGLMELVGCRETARHHEGADCDGCSRQRAESAAKRAPQQRSQDGILGYVTEFSKGEMNGRDTLVGHRRV